MKKAMLFVFLLPLYGTAQNITFDWLNQPCASTLSCDSGCTACNLPVNSGTQFIGNNVGFLGVDICPHPVVIGDNALLTYGWPAIADTAHMVIVTGLAFTPTRIDSIIIRHRGGSDGPQRVLVKFGVNVSLPQIVIADIYTPDAFGNSVLTDLGVVQASETMVYGFFELTLQPYQGSGGSWDLDELRIVGSPAASAGISEFQQRPDPKALRFDLLGQPANNNGPTGLYIDRFRRVTLN